MRQDTGPLHASVISRAITPLAVTGVAIFAVFMLATAGGRARQEAAVMAALQAVHQAQTRYRIIDRDADGYIEYATSMDELAAAGLIEPELASEEFFGYRFVMLEGAEVEGRKVDYSQAPDGKGTLDGFSVAAVPAEGKGKCYFISETGKLHTGKAPCPGGEVSYLPEGDEVTRKEEPGKN